MISLMSKTLELELVDNADKLLTKIIDEPLRRRPTELENAFFDIVITISQISPTCKQTANQFVEDYKVIQEEKWMEPAYKVFYKNRV
jgi:hypothetical protein